MGWRQGIAVAASWLVSFHWLQPLSYFAALFAYWKAIDSLQRLFGSIIALRELVYLIGSLFAVVVSPAFLFISLGATMREQGGILGAAHVLVYIVAPEKVVGMSLCRGSKRARVIVVLCIIVLDLAAIGALYAALDSGVAPLPLILGYCVTALGGAAAVGIVLAEASLGQLKQMGLGARQLKESGYEVRQLKSVGFDAVQLKNAGFDAQQMREGGFDAAELKDAGFDAQQMREGGFDAAELKDAGFGAQLLRGGGFDAAELMGVGFSVVELRSGGFSAELAELKQAVVHKVGTSMVEVRAATQINWDGKGLDAKDTKVIVLLLAEDMTSLNTLVLSSNKIGDEGAAAIAVALRVNASLTTLNLFNNNIGPRGATAIAEALKVNASMTILDIGQNEIGDAGAAAIADALRVNASLKELFLIGNQIGDAGAAAIADALRVNASLNGLRLVTNNIGNEGATAIAKALEVNASLKTLHLRENQIGDASAAAIADALRVNASMTKLGLGSNKIGDAAKAKLGAIAATRQNLNIYL